jgi:hypothetical protein
MYLVVEEEIMKSHGKYQISKQEYVKSQGKEEGRNFLRVLLSRWSRP